MAEALGSSIFLHGDSDVLHGASLAEEFVDSVLGSVEAEVTAEDSVGLTSSSAGGTILGGLLSREFAADLSVVEPESIGFSEGLLGIGVLLVFDEADSLGSSHG